MAMAPPPIIKLRKNTQYTNTDIQVNPTVIQQNLVEAQANLVEIMKNTVELPQYPIKMWPNNELVIQNEASTSSNWNSKSFQKDSDLESDSNKTNQNSFSESGMNDVIDDSV